jgi:HEAT repeat protein
MGKRVYIALAAFTIALVSVFVWLAWQQREPVYQGKPLSEWLSLPKIETGKGAVVVKDDRRAEAVREAGTKAIPTLLRMLRAKDSPLKLKVLDLAQRQHIIKIEYTKDYVWNFGGRYGFEVLGTNAQSAAPALIEIMNQNISQESRCCAIYSLGLIGSSAKEAVPSLMRWATNTDSQVRQNAVWALGKIRSEPDRVLPVLIGTLHAPDSAVQICGVMALEEFGPDAKRAVPALVELLNDPSLDLRNVTNAIKAIDPEAAAKAGVK